MMNKQELNEAFSQLRASDDLLQGVLDLEKERAPRPNAWKIVHRVAACAAVLAIVLTALLWPANWMMWMRRNWNNMNLIATNRF